MEKTLQKELEERYTEDKGEYEFCASKFVMVYDFLIWKLDTLNDATIASYLINCESLWNDTHHNLNFECTTSYLKNRICLSDNTIEKCLKTLKENGYIRTAIYNGHRYIKLNHKRFTDVLNEFADYHEKLDNSQNDDSEIASLFEDYTDDKTLAEPYRQPNYGYQSTQNNGYRYY